MSASRSIPTFLGVCAISFAAHAQSDTTPAPSSPPALPNATAAPPATSPPAEPTPPPPRASTVHDVPVTEPPPPVSQTDHEGVVRRIGLHYFGASAVSELDPTGIIATTSTPVPAIGGRFWFSDRAGVEVGIAFGFSTGSNGTTTNGLGMNTTNPSQTIAGATVGIPVMLADTQHLTCFLDPFVSFYYGYGALDVPAGAFTTSYRLNSLTLQGGLAIAAEVHLGFMRLPHVSVEARFGLEFTYQDTSLNTYANGQQTGTDASNVSFGTTLGDFAFQSIFMSSLAATYHF